MRSQEFMLETADRLRTVYNRFFTSPLSKDIEPIDLLDELVSWRILTENEADLVRSEKILIKRQFWLFVKILPLKGDEAFYQLEYILCHCGYHIDTEKWVSFLIDGDLIDHPDPDSESSTYSRFWSFLSGLFKNDASELSGSQIERDGAFTTLQPPSFRIPFDLRSRPCFRRSADLPMQFSVKSESIERMEKINGAEGTYGSIWRGFFKREMVAVKKLIKPEARKEEMRIRMFSAEINILRKLDHPNVVNFVRFVYEPEKWNLWILTEYVKGGSMSRFCPPDGELMDLKSIIEISKQCWRGLAYLHKESLWHRDISPDNILVSSDKKKIKIADFGWSEFKEYVTVSSWMEHRSLFFGKPPYTPPECMKNGYTAWNWERLDVYAMGATLSEFSSGRYFWRFDPKSDSEKRNAEVFAKLERQAATYEENGEITRPDCWDSVPEEIRSILNDAVRLDYTNRKTADELTKEFEQLQLDNLFN